MHFYNSPYPVVKLTNVQIIITHYANPAPRLTVRLRKLEKSSRLKIPSRCNNSASLPENCVSATWQAVLPASGLKNFGTLHRNRTLDLSAAAVKAKFNGAIRKITTINYG